MYRSSHTLHLALAWCTRRLLRAHAGQPAAGDLAFAEALPPATRACWHALDDDPALPACARDALRHLFVAHDVLGTDQPALLRERACAETPPPVPAREPQGHALLAFPAGDGREAALRHLAAWRAGAWPMQPFHVRGHDALLSVGIGATLRIDLLACTTVRAPPTALNDGGLAAGLAHAQLKPVVLHPAPAPKAMEDAALLALALERLEARDAAFRALDPTRRPRLLVLCRGAGRRHAVQALLRTRLGVRGAVHAVTAHTPVPTDARVLVDAVPPRCAPDPRIAVVALLRDGAASPTSAWLAPAWPAAWREPAPTALRQASIDAIHANAPPPALLDVLDVVDAPDARGAWAPLRAAGLAVDALEEWAPPATGDLRVAVDANEDVVLPHVPGAPPRTLRATLPRLVRMADALDVRRCPRRVLDVGDATGLARAFALACERDPAVQLHGRPAPGLPLLPGLRVDAVARTAWATWLVSWADGDARAGFAALDAWCVRANASDAGGDRALPWRAVALPPPAFWRAVHAGRSITTLLAAHARRDPAHG